MVVEPVGVTTKMGSATTSMLEVTRAAAGTVTVITRGPLTSLAIVATVMLSIFAHGISTALGINLYGRQMEKLPPDSPEKKEIAEDPRLERIWKKL